MKRRILQSRSLTGSPQPGRLLPGRFQVGSRLPGRISSIVLALALLVSMTPAVQAAGAPASKTAFSPVPAAKAAAGDAVLMEDATGTISLEGTFHQTDARSILAMINAFRTESGVWFWNSDNTTQTVYNAEGSTYLGELVYDYDLEQIAMQRAAEIAVSFSHTRPNGTRCFTLTSNGISSYGENIAYGYTSAESVFDGWREETLPYSGQGHRRNMLTPGFTAVGVGCFEYGGRLYWVQEFSYYTGSRPEETANDSAASVDVEVPASGTCGDDLTWSVRDGVLTISGTGEMDDYSESYAPWEFYGSSITTVIIESGVTGISDGAFYYCSGLLSLTVPSSLTSIGRFAFYNSNALQDIHYSGTAEQWSQIQIGDYNETLSSATMHYPDHTHRVTVKNASAATCTADGYTGDEVCTICGAIIKRGVNVPASGHTPGEAVKENESAATCSKEGSYEEVTYCTVCGEEISRIKKTEAKLSHREEPVPAVPATCTEPGMSAGARCSVCGEILTAQKEVPASGHRWSEWTIAKEASIHEEGLKTRTCSICGETESQAIPKTKMENPFLDVVSGTYYYDAVMWAVYHDPQITNGTSAEYFSPEGNCTRGQIVTFLWRAAGQPEPESAGNPFRDVEDGAYYYKAVLWAVEKGITTGTGKDTFSPDAACTRAQVVTFLYRYEGNPKVTGAVNPFRDVPAGIWYTDAVLWAVNHDPQITNGTSKNTFSPEAACTRGQIVTFLYRAVKE